MTLLKLLTIFCLFSSSLMGQIVDIPDSNFKARLILVGVDTNEDGEIQAIAHKEYNISAVQFHPESILTEVGEQIVRNFINANSQKQKA